MPDTPAMTVTSDSVPPWERSAASPRPPVTSPSARPPRPTSSPWAAPSRPAPAAPTAGFSAGPWPSSALRPRPTRSTPSGSLSGSALSGPTGLRPHGTSLSMPSGQPRRTGSGKAGSPPTSPGCSSGAGRGPIVTAPCPAARLTSCSPARTSACASGRFGECCTRPPPGRPRYSRSTSRTSTCPTGRPGSAAKAAPSTSSSGRPVQRDCYRGCSKTARRAGVRYRAEGPCAAPRGRPGRARTRQAQLPAGPVLVPGTARIPPVGFAHAVQYPCRCRLSSHASPAGTRRGGRAQ